MAYSIIDILIIVAYFVTLLAIGFWKGRGKQDDSGQYFIAKGTLPWWVIGAAYVATGMNTEQLIGLNGMGYTIGLTMINWCLVAMFVYPLLVYVFFPVYLRNQIYTMPQYLGRRFNSSCENLFSLILLVSYVFLNLAVVFYGGAKLLEVVFGLDLIWGLLILALVAGLYTMYGGMSSMVYAAVIQFILIFVSGFALFWLAYNQLPNGWSDIVTHSPGGFHLIQSADYNVIWNGKSLTTIPWTAIPATILGLHLFYSCINQALVQRGFGAKTEWDVRMAILIAGFFVLLRPFIEIIPGMIYRALVLGGDGSYPAPSEIDAVFPMLIQHLVPVGLKGLIIVGILSSVMSTIAAFLNSISTLFTFDVYKKWFRPDATEKELVRVGVLATLALMVFAVLYSPVIGMMGGIFHYFQSIATYVAVPIATVFLFGMFWKRTTSIAAFLTMIVGIPFGVLLHKILIPWLCSPKLIADYSLDNFFIVSGITQIFCAVGLIVISLLTKSRDPEDIKTLIWTPALLKLPASDPKHPWYTSSWFWCILLVIACTSLYILWW